VGEHPVSVRQWLTRCVLERFESESVLCFVLKQPRSFLFSHSDELLTQAQIQQLNDIEQRRQAGEPLAYIIGSIEFWSLSFDVSPAVLIPRDDTGCLVEVGLELLKRVPETGIVIDAGTGSGAVAIAFAHETGCKVTAIDQSKDALRIAEANATRLTPGLVTCQHGNWLEGIGNASVRLLLSNPPYIADADPHLQAPELQHEPQSALVAGLDGLDDIRTLSEQAANALIPGGAVAFEHGYDQGKAVRSILQSAGFKSVSTVQDLAGHDRVTHALAP